MSHPRILSEPSDAQVRHVFGAGFGRFSANAVATAPGGAIAIPRSLSDSQRKSVSAMCEPAPDAAEHPRTPQRSAIATCESNRITPAGASGLRTRFNTDMIIIERENAMTRQLLASTIAVIALMGWSGAAPLAHPGHEQKVLGTVSMTAPDHLMLKDKAGADHTIQINAATKFVRAKKAMKAEDIKVGMRVVVTAVTDESDDKLIATSIELGPMPAAK